MRRQDNSQKQRKKKPTFRGKRNPKAAERKENSERLQKEAAPAASILTTLVDPGTGQETHNITTSETGHPSPNTSTLADLEVLPDEHDTTKKKVQIGDIETCNRTDHLRMR